MPARYFSQAYYSARGCKVNACERQADRALRPCGGLFYSPQIEVVPFAVGEVEFERPKRGREKECP